MSTLKVGTIQSKTGNTGLTIADGGQVSPKLKTSFVFVYPTGSSGYNTVTTNQYLPLNTIYQSKGTGASDFNTTTYKYTAPVNGIYQITLAGITNNAGNSVHFNLDIDGTPQYVFTWSDGRDYHSSISQYLNAGEVVGFKSANSSGYYRHSDTFPSTAHYSYATFHLVEEIV